VLGQLVPGNEPAMALVFLASPYGRRLPAAPPSRGRPCLGLGVILMYLATHEGEPPTGVLHPHTHAHAGRTPAVPPDHSLAAVLENVGGRGRAAAGDR